MKNQIEALLLICLIGVVIPLCNGILDQDPKAVESWIENIGNAKEKTTKLQFYWHETLKGDNPTSLPIANASSSPSMFRYTAIGDVPLREGPQPTSKLVGRAQGLVTASDQQELSVLGAYNLEFIEGELNGSTLSLLGRIPLTHTYMEISIVGGSGVFRLARGIVTFAHYYFNLTSGHMITKCNLVVLHY